MRQKRINCRQQDWQELFYQHAASGEEMDLLNFIGDRDAQHCERIAARHGMKFTTDTEHDTAFLRRPIPPLKIGDRTISDVTERFAIAWPDDTVSQYPTWIRLTLAYQQAVTG